MFHAIEKFRRPAQVLLGLIAISFVSFGLIGFELSNNKDYLVRVGDQIINRDDVDRAVENMAQSGAAPSRELAFRTLLDQAYLMEGAKRLGIVVSDTQIKQSIVDNPAFHDASGKFDSNLFQTFIQRAYGNEEIFMREERQRLTVLSLLNTLGHNLAADSQANQLVLAQLSARQVRSVPVVAAAFAKQVNVNDQALKNFFQSHQKDYVLPEAVKFEYVLLTPDSLVEKQSVSEEEIQHAFQQSQQTNTKRRVAHILFEATDDASRAKAIDTAQKVAQQLKQHPEQFAQLAKQYSQDISSKDKGGDLGEFAQDGQLGSTALEKAVFALSPGQISDVIESEFGFHIVHVSLAAHNDLASQKADLIAKIKEKKAQAAYNKLREDFADATFNQPESLKPSADQFGFNTQHANDWVTRQSQAFPAAVLDILFSEDMKAKKHNSDAIVVQGKTWFVRVTESRKEAAQTFEQVKEQVKNDFIAHESRRLAKESAEKTLADLRAGTEVKLAWSPVQTVLPAQLRAALSPEAYTQLMNTVPKNGRSAFLLLDMQPEWQLVEVQSIETLAANPALLQQAKQFAKENSSNNLIEAFIEQMSQEIKTKQGTQTLNNEE